MSAVRLVFEQQPEHQSQWAAIGSIASKMGCTSETLRKWVRQAERDASQRPELTSSERERLKELERENRELKRANVILGKASLGSVYGADRVWRQLRRERRWVARCTSSGCFAKRVSRSVRGRAFRVTTTSGDEAARPPSNLVPVAIHHRHHGQLSRLLERMPKVYLLDDMDGSELTRLETGSGRIDLDPR